MVRPADSIGTFPVTVLFYIESSVVAKALEPHMNVICGPFSNEEILGTVFYFQPELVTSQKLFAQKLIEFLYLKNKPNIVVISDRLVNDQGIIAPSRVSSVIHGSCLSNKIPCQQIALVSKPTATIHPMVSCLSTQSLDRFSLRNSLLKAAARIQLLSPSVSAEAPSVVMNEILAKDTVNYSFELVKSEEELAECFALRRNIYGLLGYLDPRVERSTSKWEMDCYDGISCQFAVRSNETAEIVGTSRLIIPNPPKNISSRMFGNFEEISETHRNWYLKIAKEIGESKYRKMLSHCDPALLPILRNANPTEEYCNLMMEAFQGTEISRLIISPKHRGQGLSKVMLQLALATAFELKKDSVFAECVSLHVPMYQEYGFCDIEGGEDSTVPFKEFPFTPRVVCHWLNGEGSPSQLEAIRWNIELFKMAIPRMREIKNRLEEIATVPVRLVSGGHKK